MRYSLFSALALSYLIVSTPLSFAHDDEDDEKGTLPTSQNQMIRLTDEGVSTHALHMKLSDSIVFLLNDTKDSLTSIEIDYHGKITHCASKNLTIQKDNKVTSAHPFSPKDFASVCFHEKGIYPFKVFGIKKAPQGIVGEIVVE